MIGVPVIPTVFGMSEHCVSTDWNGGSRVIMLTSAPVKPSTILRLFWLDTRITSSFGYPFGVYTSGLA